MFALHPEWKFFDPKISYDYLGFIPLFLNLLDDRSAIEQLDENYSHGGGWRHFEGFELLENGNIQYPGDPEYQLLAETEINGDTVRFYPNSWVMVIRPDETWEICRMD